jgi:ribonuclease D
MNVSFTIVNTVEGWHQAISSLRGASPIAVDLEGDLEASGNLSLITVEGGGKIYVFDILECPDILEAGLANILQDQSLVKIFHDCRADSEALFGQQSVTLCNVFDTQVAHAIMVGRDPRNFRVGLNVVLETYSSYTNPHKEAVHHRPGLWDQRPLPKLLLEYAAYDVKFLREAYFKLRFSLNERALLPAASAASQQNVDYGLTTALRKAAIPRAARPALQPPPTPASLAAAWMDSIAAHLSAAGGGGATLTTIGALFPRPPGVSRSAESQIFKWHR